ncbi:hypothetical protein Tco_1537931 [Tanacetum coccineum]
MEILLEPTSSKLLVGGSSKLNLPDHRYKRRSCNLILVESDSLPHAHAQATKTYYKHQDSRIKKAQELKTKTFANSDIKDPFSETKLQGRLLASKYVFEHGFSESAGSLASREIVSLKIH